MRKPLAFFVAGFATVAGGGFAVALEGSPASSSHDVPDGPPFSDMEWVGELPPGPPPHAVADAPAEDTVEVVEVQQQEETTEDTPTTENHGAVVSEAAHTCPTGPGHGECVSEVARENPGQADDADDTEAPETEAPDVEDDAEEPPGNGNGHQNSNGRGHGEGRGGGHERDGE